MDGKLYIQCARPLPEGRLITYSVLGYCITYRPGRICIILACSKFTTALANSALLHQTLCLNTSGQTLILHPRVFKSLSAAAAVISPKKKKKTSPNIISVASFCSQAVASFSARISLGDIDFGCWLTPRCTPDMDQILAFSRLPAWASSNKVVSKVATQGSMNSSLTG